MTLQPNSPVFKMPINLTPRLLSDLGDDATPKPLHRALEECASIAAGFLMEVQRR